MSDPDIGGGEPSGLRWLLHAHFCDVCPDVSRFERIKWFDGERQVMDFREADLAGVLVERDGQCGKIFEDEMLCPEGFELARQARARGWGA
jgi:hypothetical protein